LQYTNAQLQFQNFINNYSQHLEQFRVQIQHQTHLNIIQNSNNQPMLQPFFFNNIHGMSNLEVSRLNFLQYHQNNYSESIKKFYPITSNMLIDYSRCQTNPAELINQMNLSYFNSLL
jgi:hypothetical protein